MAIRKEQRLFIFLFIGLILIAGIVSYYAWDSQYQRQNREITDIMESVEERIVQDNLQEAEIRQAAREKIRQTRKYTMKLSRAFQEGRCEDFLNLLKSDKTAAFPENIEERLLKADLYMRGKCYPQDFSKAFSLYDSALKALNEQQKDDGAEPAILFEEYYEHVAHIKFRLAALYGRGQGVEKDQKKALKHSQEAALMLAPRYAKVQNRPAAPELGPANVWNMSDIEILENVSLHATGPWPMPDPLIQQIKWLKDIHAKGGTAYLETGLNLLRGTDGYKKYPELAYEWIYIASHFYDNGLAHYVRAMLLRDEEFYALKNRYFIFSPEFNQPREEYRVMNRSNDLLLRAVKAGDTSAAKILLRFHQKTPAYFGQQADIYFWMLKLSKQNDPEVTDEMLFKMREKLDKIQIETTEKNLREDKYPRHFLRP